MNEVHSTIVEHNRGQETGIPTRVQGRPAAVAGGGGEGALKLELRELARALLGARDAQRLLLVVVEVGRVAGATTLWQEWCFHLERPNGYTRIVKP